VLAPDAAASAVFAEVQAGSPVLVLQDLGVAWLQRWHFAVVVGVDAGREVVILRSGRERRRIEPMSRFLDSWERGGRWAMLAPVPGRLPATATPDLVVRTLEESGGLLPPSLVADTYQAALKRWPRAPMLLFAAANVAYAGARLDDAQALYLRLLALDPHHAAGRNNYANLLLDRGCGAAALDHARAALADLDRDRDGAGRFREAVTETLGRAEALAGAQPSATSPMCGSDL
jgi:tetratricopeptide (TPR) repeat protein